MLQKFNKQIINHQNNVYIYKNENICVPKTGKLFLVYEMQLYFT